MKSECALWEGGDWCSVSAPLEWFGVSPHTGKLFTLLRSSLARERNSVIHHLYFYRHLISASPSVLLFYGRQVLIGAREFSEFYITNVIPSIVKIECCFVSLRIFCLLRLLELTVVIYNEKSGGRDNPTSCILCSSGYARKLRVFTEKYISQIFFSLQF